jgi:hypothetical protein
MRLLLLHGRLNKGDRIAIEAAGILASGAVVCRKSQEGLEKFVLLNASRARLDGRALDAFVVMRAGLRTTSIAAEKSAGEREPKSLMAARELPECGKAASARYIRRSDRDSEANRRAAGPVWNWVLSNHHRRVRTSRIEERATRLQRRGPR